MNQPAPIKKRLERFLYGDFVADDLTHLFLFLRRPCFGRQAVREVGDFIAHFGERDRGPSTELLKDFFSVMRFQVLLIDAKPRSLSGLSVPVKLFKAAFASIDPEAIRGATKLKPKIAKRVFETLMTKAKAVQGINQSAKLDPSESTLLHCLLSTITVRPAFDDDQLFKEFSEVLQKNKLLASGEVKHLKKKKALISLHAIVHMHQCDLLLDDAYRAHLMASRSSGTIIVNAAAPCPTLNIPTLHISRSLFCSRLRVEDWCEAELLEGDAGQSKWNFPIEIGPNQKLRRLCVQPPTSSK